MSSLLKARFSWRGGYAIVVVAYVLLAACFGLTLKRWPQAVRSPGPTSQASPKAQDEDTLKLPVVWLSILLFFTFTGMEASSAQWSYTLFTEGRGISAQTAGLWVSVYWASMTLGRVFFGIVADKVRVAWLVRICMGSVLLGALLIWSATAPALAFLGLALAGFALSPLFPVLTSDTPNRLGSEHAANAIGYQITAVKLGLAAIPALGGVLSERLGVESIGPFLFAVSVAMILLHEGTERTYRRDAG
jgi:fucose permease